MNTATIHLIPTLKAMEHQTIANIERDTGRSLKATGELVSIPVTDMPKRIPLLQMPNESYKTIMADLGFPTIHGDKDEH